jgi:hypothetical protein
VVIPFVAMWRSVLILCLVLVASASNPQPSLDQNATKRGTTLDPDPYADWHLVLLEDAVKDGAMCLDGTPVCMHVCKVVMPQCAPPPINRDDLKILTAAGVS